jgi:hypothetical protein
VIVVPRRRAAVVPRDSYTFTQSKKLLSMYLTHVAFWIDVRLLRRWGVDVDRRELLTLATAKLLSADLVGVGLRRPAVID